MNNLTRPCTCDQNGDQVSGRQICSVLSGWEACECDAVSNGATADTGGGDRGVGSADLEINKGDSHFTWQRTMPSGGSCKAGHYEGSFDGDYVPSMTFGFGTTNVSGNLSLDLQETATGEFFEISGGTMTGLALDMYPFEGEIVGTLDCATGYADAYMKNCYYIFWGLQTFFEGPLLALYDKFNHAFVEGVWSVTELDMLGTYADPSPVHPGDPLPPLPFAGGVGNWTANWTP